VTQNVSLPSSTEIRTFRRKAKAEPLINLTLLGIKISFREQHENAFDSISRNTQFSSNEIDESESQKEKQSRQRTSILPGTVAV
jgi:hypothetical protein